MGADSIIEGRRGIARSSEIVSLPCVDQIESFIHGGGISGRSPPNLLIEASRAHPGHRVTSFPIEVNKSNKKKKGTVSLNSQRRDQELAIVGKKRISIFVPAVGSIVGYLSLVVVLARWLNSPPMSVSRIDQS